jgi:hypothetical protein
MMSEWGLTDTKTADLLLRRRSRMGVQRKKAEKKRELQDPLRRLEHAQQLARAWHATDEPGRRGGGNLGMAAAAGGDAGSGARPAALPRASHQVLAQGRMWGLSREDDAGSSGAVDEAGLGDELEVAPVHSTHSDLLAARVSADHPLRSFTSAAPNGKLARMAQRPAVPLYQQRIGWD